MVISREREGMRGDIGAGECHYGIIPENCKEL